MKELTIDELKAMKPGTIFATGVVSDDGRGVNMTGSGNPLRWVATRGGIHDWAIYIHWADKPEEWVQQHGDKIHSMSTVKRLVPATDEALEMYRH